MNLKDLKIDTKCQNKKCIKKEEWEIILRDPRDPKKLLVSCRPCFDQRIHRVRIEFRSNEEFDEGSFN